MKNIDAHLLIIGNGELFFDLNKLIIESGLQNKVTIKKSVPHNQIQDYYKSAKIFALAYNTEVESLPMPVIEAMAAGIPVVLPHPKKGFTEGLEDIAIFSDMNAESFSINIQRILEDKSLMEKFSKKALIKAKEFDGNSKTKEIANKATDFFLKKMSSTKLMNFLQKIH